MARLGTPLAPRNPERAARHVAHELGMLRAAFGGIRGAGLINAVKLECFLVHTRNLIEFFWDRAPKGAILPKDFGAAVRRDKDKGIAELHNEISQLLTHLTWARVQVHELRPQDWSYTRLSRIHDAIRTKAQGFLSGLSDHQRLWFVSDAFPNEYRYWIR